MTQILFGEREPDVYKKDMIYDPDIHGLDPNITSRIVPAPGSLVIDMSDAPAMTYGLYVVSEVSGVNDIPPYKSTLVPVSSLMDSHLISDKLMSYGNDIYMLYYDIRTTPVSLRVSSNLMILGDNSAEYVLFKHELDGSRTPISINRDAGGIVTGNRVPIVATASPGIRRPNDCETSMVMTDNDLITMEVYDSSGIKNMDIILISKRATILNDLSAINNIVTGFEIDANQEDGSGSMVLFTGQNKDDIAISPNLEFSTGERRIVPVDGATCFMYGWGDVQNNLVGMEYNILFKYYLSGAVQTTLPMVNPQWITTTKLVTVIPRNMTTNITKISPMVIYDYNTSTYSIKYFAYYEERNALVDVTSQIMYRDSVAFDGTLGPGTVGQYQPLQLRLELLDVNGIPFNYDQDIMVLVDLETATEPFLIKDDPTNVLIYGQVDVSHTKPIINYNSATEEYVISNVLFPDVNKFIENFFLNANPPWVEPAESISPTPTHFTIRNLQGVPIIPVPVAVGDYDTITNLTISNGDPAQWNLTTVIVEFLLEVGSTYPVLYGVPVQVRGI